jgi:hypothetical protein
MLACANAWTTASGASPAFTRTSAARRASFSRLSCSVHRGQGPSQIDRGGPISGGKDVEALACKPLDDTVELGNERTYQIIEHIHSPRSQPILGVLRESMKAEDEAVTLVQDGDAAAAGYEVPMPSDAGPGSP